MVRIEAAFIVLEEQGPTATLECPRCGLEFLVNSYTGENLLLDLQQKRQLAVCPLCGTVEKPDRRCSFAGTWASSSHTRLYCRPKEMPRHRWPQVAARESYRYPSEPNASLWHMCMQAGRGTVSPWAFWITVAILAGCAR
jgi:hypothetical protein